MLERRGVFLSLHRHPSEPVVDPVCLGRAIAFVQRTGQEKCRCTVVVPTGIWEGRARLGASCVHFSYFAVAAALVRVHGTAVVQGKSISRHSVGLICCLFCFVLLSNELTHFHSSVLHFVMHFMLSTFAAAVNINADATRHCPRRSLCKER